MQPVANFTLNCCFLRTVSAEVGVKEKRTILAICPMKTCSKRRDALSRLRIQTNCFPRAFVTTKAYVDKDPHFKELAQGRKFQEFLAKQLHREAGVPEGPYGRAEIQQFQAHVGSEGNQIIVLEGQQGMIWYKDHTYDDAHKKICLFKVQNHFHGLRSIPALLNRSYYFHHCKKGYDHETSEKQLPGPEL